MFIAQSPVLRPRSYSTFTSNLIPRFLTASINSAAGTATSIETPPAGTRPRAWKPIIMAQCQPVSRSMAVKPVALS